MSKGYEVLGYFYHKDDVDNLNGTTVMVAIDEGYDRLTYYSPVGQHSEGSREYLEECIAIDKETYLKYNNGAYTPVEYLDPKNVVGNVEYYVTKILSKYDSLEDLCEALDTCYDLYDLGYIDTPLEQNVYEALADTSSLTLWAMYRYVNKTDKNYEYTFNYFVNEYKAGK